MKTANALRNSIRSWRRPAVVALALAGLLVVTSQTAEAQEGARRPRPIAAHARSAGRVATRVLTVRRRSPRFASGYRYVDPGYEAPALLRRWNDPNLDSFGGWRLGGDNFYGDGRGDTITRGNSTLGMISGYGPARGGYGGPHFDSVGGFHNGPGPDAQEDDDYASGSISTPDYGGLVPRYPSVKARVAALNTGVVSRGSPRLERANYRGLAAPAKAAPTPSQGVDGEQFLRSEDLIPDLGIDAF